MSDVATFSDPLYVLLGALGSAFCGAVIWICKNKCRNQSMDCNSGCFRFHSDSRLRETIREVFEEEKKRSVSGDLRETSEEIELTFPKVVLKYT